MIDVFIVQPFLIFKLHLRPEFSPVFSVVTSGFSGSSWILDCSKFGKWISPGSELLCEVICALCPIVH